MKYTINYREIGFNSSSGEVEALRRAVEIRSASRELNRDVRIVDGVESYCWKTPLCDGSLEVEYVTVCEETGVVTYSRTECSRAS